MISRSSRRWRGPRAALRGPLAAVAVLGVVSVAACGSTREPEQQQLALAQVTAAAQTAVREAERADAMTLAPTEFGRARAKLEQTEAALADERPELARRLAEQALVDAELAAAKARAEVSRRNLAEMQANLEALRSEAARRPIPMQPIQ